MNGYKRRDREFPLDRCLFFTVRVVLGLILFPVLTLLAISGVTEVLVSVGLFQRHVEGGTAAVTILGATVGLAISAIMVWKSGGIFRKALAVMRSKLPEPAQSCIEFGIVGSLIFGGVMVAGIFLLGHTRPIGWDLNRVLPSMGLGFALFLIGGLPVGLWRKRRRSS